MKRKTRLTATIDEQGIRLDVIHCSLHDNSLSEALLPSKSGVPGNSTQGFSTHDGGATCHCIKRVGLPSSSSLTSLAAFSPSFLSIWSISLERLAAAASSALRPQPILYTKSTLRVLHDTLLDLFEQTHSSGDHARFTHTRSTGRMWVYFRDGSNNVIISKLAGIWGIVFPHSEHAHCDQFPGRAMLSLCWPLQISTLLSGMYIIWRHEVWMLPPMWVCMLDDFVCESMWIQSISDILNDY